LRTFWPLNRNGLPSIRPLSLAKAMTEPEAARPPTSTVSTMATAEKVTTPSARTYSAQPTSIEARPPEPLSSATISGISVICTRRAAIAPIAVPTTRPTRIQV
jgi:hypothetical protein